MATRNFAYDHPMYQTPVTAAGVTTSGGSQTSHRFTAYTNMIAKAAQFYVVTAGTSAGNQFGLNKVSGTTTTAITTCTIGTNVAGYTTNVTLSDMALLAGDQLVTRTGTDATGIVALSYELLISPGANATV